MESHLNPPVDTERAQTGKTYVISSGEEKEGVFKTEVEIPEHCYIREDYDIPTDVVIYSKEKEEKPEVQFYDPPFDYPTLEVPEGYPELPEIPEPAPLMAIRPVTEPAAGRSGTRAFDSETTVGYPETKSGLRSPANSFSSNRSVSAGPRVQGAHLGREGAKSGLAVKWDTTSVAGEDMGRDTEEDAGETNEVDTGDDVDAGSNSDDYDTDLEPEEPPKDRDITGINRYYATCKKVQIPPASPVVRSITSRQLRMPHYGLGRKGSAALRVPLEVNTTLTKINLKGNWLGTGGIEELAEVFQDSSYITELNLASNYLGTPGAELMCTAMKNHNFLKVVDLSDNQFKDKDAPFLCKILEENTKLRELNLSNNEFGTESGILFGEALVTNDTLEVLDLSWNHFRLKGACAIANGVAVNDGLIKLNLSMNGFASQGTLSMKTALTVNDTLEELDISNNRIPSPVIADFASCLEKNETLKTLKLGNNPILYNGAVALIEAIQNNEASKLKFLDLKDVVVLQEFMDIVDEVKEERPGFKVNVGCVSGVKILEKTIDRFGDKNPLEILLIFMGEKNLRLTDLFRTFDKDQSMSLSREEFITGLKSVNTPMSEAQLNELIDMLDKDGDGEVDLKEILNINTEFRDIKRKAYGEVQKVKKEKKEKKTKPAPDMAAIAKLLAMKSQKKEERTKLEDLKGEEKEQRESELAMKAASVWKVPKKFGAAKTETAA